MKIGLNATCFNGRPSGANQRFYGIYRELVKNLPDTEFVLYEPSDYSVGTWFEGAANVTVRQTPIPSSGRVRKVLKGFGYWNTFLKDEKFDIFEVFNLPHVKSPNGQTLMTLHDVRRMHSKIVSKWDYILMKSTLDRAMKNTDHIITVSYSMKKEIQNLYPQANISVIYNGFDAFGFDDVNEDRQQEFRIKYSLPSEFILAVGHFIERKNYLRLIDAIALLHTQGRRCNLIIIGNDSGEGKVMKERIDSMNLSSHIKIFTGLSDLEVRCAYKLCSLFVFPSAYEGFGIPILEAMAANVPMVLSDISVFREITQDQGVYFPYNDSQAIANAINEILSSDSEKNRLIQYGNKRVQDFSFKKIAMDLADVYKTLL